MEQNLLLCGKTKKNLYTEDKKFSDCVDIIMVEKTLEEMMLKRQSLLRMNNSISNNSLVVRTDCLNTIYGSIELSVCYKESYYTLYRNCMNDYHFQQIKNKLKEIYEQKSSNVNLISFSHKYNSSVNFWWDINNDIMWSFDNFYMKNYLLNNLVNSTVSLKENNCQINDIELCKDLSCVCG